MGGLKSWSLKKIFQYFKRTSVLSIRKMEQLPYFFKFIKPTEMENIIHTISSKVDEQSWLSLSQKTNTSPNQAKHALLSAIHILITILAKNNKNPEKAVSLQQAIEHDHDGSIFNRLDTYFHDPDTANGPGILKHMLGENHRNAVEYITKDSGVSESSATKMLEVAAPLVMGHLGENHARSGLGIGSLLNSHIQNHRQEDPESQTFINKLFDMDDEGKLMDDMKEMGKSFLGKPSG